MKGLLATLIIGSGAILISTSVAAQETSISPSEVLSPIQGQECSGYLSSCLPNIGGEQPATLEERVKYTQEEINYAINGEGQGDKLEGSAIRLTPEQRAELENSSSPNGLIFGRF